MKTEKMSEKEGQEFVKKLDALYKMTPGAKTEYQYPKILVDRVGEAMDNGYSSRQIQEVTGLSAVEIKSLRGRFNRLIKRAKK